MQVGEKSKGKDSSYINGGTFRNVFSTREIKLLHVSLVTQLSILSFNCTLYFILTSSAGQDRISFSSTVR